MVIKRNLLLFASLMFVSIFIASELFASGVESIVSQYKSIRPMGMGNIFTTITDNGDAFYYNPAGIANINHPLFAFQPLRLLITRDLYDEIGNITQLADDVGKVRQSDDPLNNPDVADERQRVLNRMERMFYETLGMDIATPTQITFPVNIRNFNLAIGATVNGWSESKVKVLRHGLRWKSFAQDILDDEILYRIIAETSYGVTTAFKFPISLLSLPIELSMGISAMKINQMLITDEDDLLSVSDLLNPNGKDNIKGTADDFENHFFNPDDPFACISKGEGYSVDAGVIVSLTNKAEVAFSLRNLMGKITYDKTKKLPKDFAISIVVNLTKLPHLNIPMMDVILATGLDSLSNKTGVQLGLETILKPLKFLSISGRIGRNQGYTSLGAGVQLLFLDLDYAFYCDTFANWHAFSLKMAFQY